jgi:hypothetical protein
VGDNNAKLTTTPALKSSVKTSDTSSSRSRSLSRDLPRNTVQVETGRSGPIDSRPSEFPSQSSRLKSVETGDLSSASGGTAIDSCTGFNFLTNPFAFNSLSVLMHDQDLWRKSPLPENVDFKNFLSGPSSIAVSPQLARGRNINRVENKNTVQKHKSDFGDSLATPIDSIWMIILMIEDEFSRAASTKFTLLHPVPVSVQYYLSLYRNARFSDHLLAKWVLNNGMHGPLRQYVPLKFILRSTNTIDRESKKVSPRKGICMDAPSSFNSVIPRSEIKRAFTQDILSVKTENDFNAGILGEYVPSSSDGAKYRGNPRIISIASSCADENAKLTGQRSRLCFQDNLSLDKTNNETFA